MLDKVFKEYGKKHLNRKKYVIDTDTVCLKIC